MYSNIPFWCLELWHGPTSAFKDIALQILPQLLSASLRMTGEKKTACVLVATSGDRMSIDGDMVVWKGRFRS